MKKSKQKKEATKTINVNISTWKKLGHIELEENLNTHDEAINHLIKCKKQLEEQQK